jgi:hypothetical protein
MKQSKTRKVSIRVKVPEGMLAIDEPVFDIAVSSNPRVEVIRAYHWYNMNYDLTDGKTWLVKYLKQQCTPPDTIDAVMHCTPPMVVCSIARMLFRNMALPEHSIDYLRKWLTSAPANAVYITPIKKTSNTVKIPTVADHINAVLSSIEQEFDSIMSGNSSEFSFYNTYKSKGYSKTVAKEVYEWTKPRLEQVESYLKDSRSPFKEYYDTQPKKLINGVFKFYTSIASDCERINANAKAVKAPRKTRVRFNADKILSKLQYKKEDDIYKITSIDPTQILSACTLVTFNTKYKYLSLYIAKAGQTLSIKGTTIINLDEDKSSRIRVRKPDEIIKKLLAGTPASITKTFSVISGTSVQFNGRINEDTIILRAAV